MKCVHSVSVCAYSLLSPGQRQRAEANEKWNVFLHTLAVWCSASRRGDVSVCQMPESREQGHLSCGGFDYVRDPPRRGRVISVDPLWQTLPLHYVTTAQVSQRPQSNCLSDSSTHSPHRSSAVLLNVCVRGDEAWFLSAFLLKAGLDYLKNGLHYIITFYIK